MVNPIFEGCTSVIEGFITIFDGKIQSFDGCINIQVLNSYMNDNFDVGMRVLPLPRLRVQSLRPSRALWR